MRPCISLALFALFAAVCAVGPATASRLLRSSAAPPAAADAATRVRYEFALKFESFPSGDVNEAYARSQALYTKTTGPGFRVVQVGDGADTEGAVWQSYLVTQEGDRWSEAGNITFVEPNRADTVFFSSLGLSGQQLLDAPDLNYGCITYNITGGTGHFKGAYGMMVDTFVSNRPTDPSAPFEINAWGIFFTEQ